MHSISSFLKKSYVRKDGRSAVYIQLILHREIIHIPIRIYWFPELWKDGEAIERFKKDPEARDVNLIVRDNLAKANEILIRYRLERREITKALFMQDWVCGSPSKDFIRYMEQKMEQRLREREIALPTFENHMVTLNHLRHWKKSLPFETLCERTAHQFEAFLLKKTGAQSNNARWGQHRNFKTYLNQAKSERIKFLHPYDYFSAKSQMGRFQPLHKDEVIRLWNLYLKEELVSYKQDALRGFLMVCLTGMRHSDVRRFQLDWIDGDFIDYEPYKTRRFGTRVRIPTNNYMLRLIMDELEVCKKGKLFQGCVEQKQNEYVRAIGQELRLSTSLCYQVGRETFATLYMEHDGKLEILASFMGHSTVKMSEKYVKIRDRRKKEEAHRIESFLEVKIKAD